MDELDDRYSYDDKPKYTNPAFMHAGTCLNRAADQLRLAEEAFEQARALGTSRPGNAELDYVRLAYYEMMSKISDLDFYTIEKKRSDSE